MFVGLPYHETKKPEEAAGPGGPAGRAGLEVGTGVAQTMWKSSRPLVAGLTEARAGLRLILQERI